MHAFNHFELLCYTGVLLLENFGCDHIVTGCNVCNLLSGLLIKFLVWKIITILSLDIPEEIKDE